MADDPVAFLRARYGPISPGYVRRSNDMDRRGAERLARVHAGVPDRRGAELEQLRQVQRVMAEQFVDLDGRRWLCPDGAPRHHPWLVPADWDELICARCVEDEGCCECADPDLVPLIEHTTRVWANVRDEHPDHREEWPL